jgi:hypothetical protein
MKFILSIVLLILINGQHGNVEGEYYDNLGTTLRINANSTFSYKWNGHNISSWSNGKWKINNDTVYFKVIPIFDTVRKSGVKDTLILSLDEKPELITERNGSISHFLSSRAQNNIPINDKLYFDGKKLIEIKRNGKLKNVAFIKKR